MPITTCGPACTTEIKNSYRPCGDPKTEYDGCVLETYERNGYDDSDFYALVWDEESQSIKTIEYASTRGWTYHNHAYVDATEEVTVKALAWWRENLVRVRINLAHLDTFVPGIGKTVRSKTTRGKNVGVTGVIKWIGDSTYRQYVKRVGIEVEGQDKLTYMDDDRVEVINPEPVDEAAIRERCMRAVPANWRYVSGA